MPGPKPVPKVLIARGDNNEDRNYQNGMRALDAGRWDEAVEYFTRVVTQNGTRADGAMYWIAWAQNKQGNGAAALACSQDTEGEPLDHRSGRALGRNSSASRPAGEAGKRSG